MDAPFRPTNLAVKPRDIHFPIEEAHSRHWLSGDAVGTAVLNAMSLTFPDGERMFMDAVRHFQHELSPGLQAEVRGFIGQEAIHSREHHILNRLLDPTVYPVEEILTQFRERVSTVRKRGPWPMLLATISLEHFTAMMTELRVIHDDLFVNAEPNIERLWRWHCLEEMEHKAVAYDVYLEVTREWSPFQRYYRRVLSMTVVTRNFVKHLTQSAARLLEAEGYTSKDARKAVNRFLWTSPGIFRRGWRSYLAWYRPGFHPWDQPAPREVAAWKSEFDNLAAPPPSASPSVLYL
jgi:predicted metal-dependent hydrolase